MGTVMTSSQLTTALLVLSSGLGFEFISFTFAMLVNNKRKVWCGYFVTVHLVQQVLIQIKCRRWQGLILCDLCCMRHRHTLTAEEGGGEEVKLNSSHSLLLRLKVGVRTVLCLGSEPNLKSGFRETWVLSAQPQLEFSCLYVSNQFHSLVN